MTSGTGQPRPIHPPQWWCTQTCRHLGPEARWTDSDTDAQLQLFPGWSRITSGEGDSAVATLMRRCLFDNFDALEPVLIRLLAIARIQDHHPEVQFGYREMTVRWNTHSAGGISDNDWICAALLEEAFTTVKR